MKKIDFKKPKYVIPALALPFVLGIGYIVNDAFASNAKSNLQSKEEIITDVPDADLRNTKKKSKLQAMSDALGKTDEYSSIQNIEDEEAASILESGDSSNYTDEEKRLIDSITYATSMYQKKNDPNLKSNKNSYYTPEEISDIGTGTGTGSRGGETSYGRESPQKSKMTDEMDLFKQQMRFLDSIENPKRYHQNQNTDNLPTPAKLKSTDQTLEVLKAENPATLYFNTVGKNEKTSLITAILDESLKVTDGSRVRIRLLDDIMLNGAIIIKGSYLYGNVSGFKAQRVFIDITSILINGKRLKVNLSIFDTDGQEGFYVPASAFRDLTKDVGGQLGSQSITMQSEAEGAQELAFGAIQDIYKSTTQALSKNVKANKAKLKYNTQVYLINNKENAN